MAVARAQSSTSRIRAILVADCEIIAAFLGMGAKYLPTDKDLKATRRFHQQQHVQSKFIKPVAPKPVKKPKQK